MLGRMEEVKAEEQEWFWRKLEKEGDLAGGISYLLLVVVTM